MIKVLPWEIFIRLCTYGHLFWLIVVSNIQIYIKMILLLSYFIVWKFFNKRFMFNDTLNILLTCMIISYNLNILIWNLNIFNFVFILTPSFSIYPLASLLYHLLSQLRYKDIPEMLKPFLFINCSKKHFVTVPQLRQR